MCFKRKPMCDPFSALRALIEQVRQQKEIREISFYQRMILDHHQDA
jgi:hypothetical protein